MSFLLPLSGYPTSQRETDHEASSSGSALPAHQVQDHPHRHQAGERPHLRRRGSHPQNRSRRHLLSPDGHQVARLGSVHGPEGVERGGSDGQDVQVEKEKVEKARQTKSGLDAGDLATYRRGGTGANEQFGTGENFCTF